MSHQPAPSHRKRRRSLLILAIAAAVCPACDRQPSAPATRTITVWAHHGQERENAAMRQIVAAFNAAHADDNLRIDITFFPDRQYADKVSIAAFSGDLPDVLDIDGPYVGPWAAEGMLRPLDEFVSAELRTDLLPSLIEQGTYQDQLYALGAFESALVVYYNRAVTAAAGLSPPERIADTWTWPQFIEALERVQGATAIPLSLHMDDQSDEWFTYAFAPLIWSNGGRLIDVAQHRVQGVLNSPQNVVALTEWQQLFRNGLAEATTTNPDPFSAGLAAFDWTGHWMLPKFAGAPDLDFGVMPLPRFAQFVCPSGSWCWGVSTASDQPELAWQAIAWFLHPTHGIKPIVEANGAVPGRLSAFQFFPEYDQMPRRLFREQLEQAAQPRPRTSVYLALTSAFAAALRDISLGADVKPTLDAAAKTVQRALDRKTPPP